ncbi:hypothetical protein HPB49_017434 [Dermacentor silvarum]|uniref:Uncharacterized protein n=1 Tax=Dermacentor silvarum TaxID=543639 RepID=A0ACB8DEJ3_DERSI|nr:hypothetical protein HPB49_017434 [Dermacentor silvarum]
MTVLGDFFSHPLDWRWITTALVFVVTYLVGRFYHRVSKYPKGPFPLTSCRQPAEKYAVSESLGNLCTDTVDAFVDSLKDRTQIVDSRKPILSMFCKVIGVSIYGTRLGEEIGDVEQLENINHRFHEISPNGLPSDIAPFLAFLYIRTERKMAALFCEFKEIFRRLFTKAEAAYIPGNTENFTHAMLTAREEAIKEDKADAQYLTKDNMILVTMNLFNEATFFLRFCAKGACRLMHGDREKLPFTVACLLETLRMHPAAPIGIPHNTTTDTRVGKWAIPKDTALMYNIYGVHHDPTNWEKPEEFRPERFLNPVTGKVRTDAGPLIAFGMGARICPGEKLAHMDMFYILVRLMQRLSCSIPDGISDVDLNGNGSSLFSHPAQQNIVFTRRD